MTSIRPGTVIDRYAFESVLGRGGMAVVFRARHTTLGTPCAIKVLTVGGEALKQRLVQEGRIQAGLVHPNIVRVFDVIQVGDAPGLVMEWVDGPSLEAMLRYQSLSLEQCDELAGALLAGVGAAHEKGLVHRDLKPGNVLIELGASSLCPKVADFGLAKVIEGTSLTKRLQTRTGVAMGTPAYMSPEQIRDAKHVDHRTDVFALGAILYHMVCGRRAFGQSDLLKLYAAIGEGNYEPPLNLRPDLPESMDRAINGALRPEKDERISDCATLLRVWRGQDQRGITSSYLRAAQGPWPPAMLAQLRQSTEGDAASRAKGEFEDDEDEENAPQPAPEARPGPPAAPATFAPVSLVEGAPLVGQSEAALRTTWAAALARPPLLIAAAAASAALVAFAVWFPVGPSVAVAAPEGPPPTAEAAVAPPESETPPSEPVAAVQGASPTGTVVRPALAPSSRLAAAPSTGGTTPIESPEAPKISEPGEALDLRPPPEPESDDAPASAPPPIAAGLARVGVTGDAKSVWLQGSAGNYRLPTDVPAGNYAIQVYFQPGEATTVGQLSLTEGQEKTLRCAVGARSCK